MINLDLTQTELDELYEALSSNQRPSARNKCLVVYLRAKGYPREAVADIARVDPDSVTHYAKQYVEGGLGDLLKNNYRTPKSQLEPHAEQLVALFKKKHRIRSTKQ